MDDPHPEFYWLIVKNRIRNMMSLLDVGFQIIKVLIRFKNGGTRTMNYHF